MNDSSFYRFNENPDEIRVGDCTVRAMSTVLGQDWDQTFIELCLQGFIMKDMPSANRVWGAYLRSKGMRRELVRDDCEECCTVRRFAEEHPEGRYLLALDGHVVAVIDGRVIDTWDSSDEVPVYYWYKEE